eukprot:13458256-Alexandrium_andersonii.AAC.1
MNLPWVAVPSQPGFTNRADDAPSRSTWPRTGVSANSGKTASAFPASRPRAVTASGWLSWPLPAGSSWPAPAGP